MEENIEETTALNPILSNTQKDNEIEKYFNFENKIKTINRTSLFVDSALHVVSRYQYNQVIQLLIPDNALESSQNILSRLQFIDQSNIEDIPKFISDNCNLDNSEKDISNNDYIESSLSSDYLIKKAKEFRQQIDLYKTYDNQHYFITKLLIEIIEYYINEYLVQQEHFSKDDKSNIEYQFQKAIEEQNYLIYFIKAYTLTNNFHHVLNKHLALYLLEYFNTSSYSSLKTKYRLINCLAHIVTLLIYHPDIHKYQFNGITYRGLLMKQNHLKSYSIGNSILNKSFVSTSKDRLVAENFADNSQLSDQNSIEVPVLLKYTIKKNETAIDIEDLSTVRDEEEVLILPFSVFQVKYIENASNPSLPMLVEIHLEECEETQQIDYEKEINNNNEFEGINKMFMDSVDKPLTTLQNRTKKRKKIVKSKCFWVIIVLCIVFTLVVTAVLIRRFLINSGKKPRNETSTQQTSNEHKYKQQLFIPDLNIKQTWKQNGTTVAGGHGNGHELYQLSFPSSIYIDDNQTIYVADTYNHRIVEWKRNVINGQIVAGRNRRGNQSDQLDWPTKVIVDKQNDSLIICDHNNQRVVRRPRRNGQSGETLIPNIYCVDLIMDNDGYLYVSDWTKHEVRRWKIGEKNGTLVAGGNRYGSRFDQLDSPCNIFIDQDHSVYVSDWGNHRVMKWVKDAKKGIVVAGGLGQGNNSKQLSGPYGIIIDQLGSVYVADGDNNRVMRWLKEAQEGTIVAGGNGQGEGSNQLDEPADLSFDLKNNLYVVDRRNNRVQKFDINLNES